jgi:hypothetical protein
MEDSTILLISGAVALLILKPNILGTLGKVADTTNTLIDTTTTAVDFTIDAVKIGAFPLFYSVSDNPLHTWLDNNVFDFGAWGKEVFL